MGIILVLLWILAIIFLPLMGIWSLNTLFALTIAYTWKTWLAALFLILLVSSSYPDRDD